MPDFAANLSTMFTELPFAERFAAAARCGFDAVELAMPYAVAKETTARLVREHDPALVAFNLPAGRWQAGECGIACHPDRVADFGAGVAGAMDCAAWVTCRFLNCLAGAVPEGAAGETAYRTLVENLRFAARLALPAGITILVEPVDSATLPASCLTSSTEAVALLDTVRARNVSLLYDVGHMHAMGEKVIAMIARHLSRIGHIQIAGCPGRGEPIGGEIDYDELFDLIDRLGHRGWVGCEYVPTADTEAGLSWMARHKVLTPRTPSRWGIPLHAWRRPDAPAAGKAM